MQNIFYGIKIYFNVPRSNKEKCKDNKKQKNIQHFVT